MDRGMYRKGPHGPFCVFIGGGACASSRQDKGCFVTDTQTRITSLVTPLLESLGLELWGLEYLPTSGRSLLRVYINVADRHVGIEDRSEEHTSELQSLMRISYAVFCLKKKIIMTEKKSLKNKTTMSK